MSNKTKQTVKLKENELVDLIDGIVNEQLVIKKQEWLNEQSKKESDKTRVLESKVAQLEANFKKLTEGKK